MFNTSKIILASVFFFICTFNANAFSTSAYNAILTDFDSGSTLYEKDSTHPLPVSAKLPAIYLILEAVENGQIKLEDELKVSQKVLSLKGPTMFLELDKMVKVEDLLRGMIILGANDATLLLIEKVYGSEEKFVEKMLIKGQQLGLSQSNFVDARLDSTSKNHMSALDIAKLGGDLIKSFPKFYSYFNEKEFAFNNVTQPNHNIMLGEEGIDGFKTDELNNKLLILSAVKDGKRLIAVLSEIQSEERKTEEVKAFFESGFNSEHSNILFKAHESIGRAKVWHGNDCGVNLVSEHAVMLPLSKDSEKAKNLKVYINYDNMVLAPVKKGEVIGSLVVKSHDETILKTPLIADKDVEEASFIRKMFQNALYRIKLNVRFE